jgi:hypothetical protein
MSDLHEISHDDFVPFRDHVFNDDREVGKSGHIPFEDLDRLLERNGLAHAVLDIIGRTDLPHRRDISLLIHVEKARRQGFVSILKRRLSRVLLQLRHRGLVPATGHKADQEEQRDDR